MPDGEALALTLSCGYTVKCSCTWRAAVIVAGECDHDDVPYCAPYPAMITTWSVPSLLGLFPLAFVLFFSHFVSCSSTQALIVYIFSFIFNLARCQTFHSGHPSICKNLW
jgi:hypothetical protein